MLYQDFLLLLEHTLPDAMDVLVSGISSMDSMAIPYFNDLFVDDIVSFEVESLCFLSSYFCLRSPPNMGELIPTISSFDLLDVSIICEARKLLKVDHILSLPAK